MQCHSGIYIGSFYAGMRSIPLPFAKYTIILCALELTAGF